MMPLTSILDIITATNRTRGKGCYWRIDLPTATGHNLRTELTDSRRAFVEGYGRDLSSPDMQDTHPEHVEEMARTFLEHGLEKKAGSSWQSPLDCKGPNCAERRSRVI